VSPIAETCERVLWSLWSELGVPGTERAHRGVVVDPEPTIAFTPHLARGDPRLIGLAFDWCRAHDAWISGARIAAIARALPRAAQHALARFNGALARHGVAWRPLGEPLELEPNRDRMALPMERPALVALRLRALAGTGARADVLTRLVFAPRGGATVTALTPSGTSRRSAELVVNELVASGWVRIHGSARGRRFSLAEPGALATLIDAIHLEWRDWQGVFELLTALAELETAGLSPRLARVRAVAAQQELAARAAALGLAAPPRLDGREDAHAALLAWGGKVTGDL
jgi:hypothetical protein